MFNKYYYIMFRFHVSAICILKCLNICLQSFLFCLTSHKIWLGIKMFVFNLWLKFCSDDTSMANNGSLFDILEVFGWFLNCDTKLNANTVCIYLNKWRNKIKIVYTTFYIHKEQINKIEIFIVKRKIWFKIWKFLKGW